MELVIKSPRTNPRKTMAKKAPFHECALCDKTAKMQRSHIIPEFQYDPLYDPLHRFSVVSTIRGSKPQWQQKGAREYLLCWDCEQKLSKWETYAKKVIFEDELHLVQRLPFGVKLGGVDYTQFRLYLLSVLWRMGVSKLPMFGNVDLGEHAERLRLALLNGAPGEPHEYACLITGITLAGRFHPDWILQPDLCEIDGIVHCRVIISGVLYVFRLSVDPLPFPTEFTLTRAQTLVMAVKDVSEVPFVEEALRRQQLSLSEKS